MIELFLARYGIKLALAGGALVLAVAWDAKRIKKAELRGEVVGVEKVVSASKEQGKQANAKNEKVRKSAAAPGALERLRQDPASCDDCNGKPMQGLATSKNKAG